MIINDVFKRPQTKNMQLKYVTIMGVYNISYKSLNRWESLKEYLYDYYLISLALLSRTFRKSARALS